MINGNIRKKISIFLNFLSKNDNYMILINNNQITMKINNINNLIQILGIKKCILTTLM